MKMCILRTAPYHIDVNGRTFCLNDDKNIICDVIGPKNGIIEFSIDSLHDLEWYEATEFNERQFDDFLKETLSQLIEVYMLSDDSKLTSKARMLKLQLLDMFHEGDNKS